jgi:NADH-quinone oxidoreductase subunit N
LCFLLQANDFIFLFLVLELQGLSLYLLASFKYENNYSAEAGIKYFTLSSYSTAIALFGISILYGITGTTNFFDVHELLNINIGGFNYFVYFGLLLSIFLILSAFLFKLSAVPFHIWVVDVYDGSPSISMLFFATLPKVGVILVLFKLIFNVFFFYNFILIQLIFISCLLSIIVGNLAALYEMKFKRIIAFSAIANVGFFLLGFYLYNIEGLQSIYFYLIIYIFILMAVFSGFLNIRRYDNFLKIKYIEDLIGVFFSNPLLSLIFIIFIFSLSGIPPLAGFFIKLYVIFNIVKTNQLFCLLVVIVINFLSYIYYVRFIRTILFENLLCNYY